MTSPAPNRCSLLALNRRLTPVMIGHPRQGRGLWAKVLINFLGNSQVGQGSML